MKYLVVENFYSDPDAIREQALKLEYSQPNSKLGYTGLQAQTWQDKNVLLSKIVHATTNTNLTCPSEWLGVFRRDTEHPEASGNLFVHTDPNDLTAVLYLGKEKYEGTAFYRTRDGYKSFAEIRAKAKSLQEFERLKEEIKAHSHDPGYWELDEYVEYQYNRMVVLNGDYFHSPGMFGPIAKSTEEGGRLLQVSFLNLKQPFSGNLKV